MTGGERGVQTNLRGNQMSRIIRGEFSETQVGRQLRFFASALERQCEAGRIADAINTCRAAESVSGDPQWKAVRDTLGLFQAQQ